MVCSPLKPDTRRALDSQSADNLGITRRAAMLCAVYLAPVQSDAVYKPWSLAAGQDCAGKLMQILVETAHNVVHLRRLAVVPLAGLRVAALGLGLFILAQLGFQFLHARG